MRLFSHTLLTADDFDVWIRIVRIDDLNKSNYGSIPSAFQTPFM